MSPELLISHVRRKPATADPRRGRGSRVASVSGNRRFEGLVLGHIGALDLEEGRREDAGRTLGEALRILRGVRHRGGTAGVLASLADLAAESGRPALALRRFEQAMALGRQIRDRRLPGGRMCDAALCAHSLGRLGEARPGGAKARRYS